jgi:hypothetical protein
MAEGVSSQVKIPPDSQSAAAHNVRTIKVPNPNLTYQSEDGAGTVVPTIEEQQVVCLADANGNLVNVKGGALCIDDATTHQLLRAVLLRLDLLNDAVTKRYAPPDLLGVN